MTPRVFLCEPSGLTVTQRLVSDQWHERLFGFGFDVDHLRSDGYAPDPWPGVKAHMAAAHGVVVLGFRQLRVGRKFGSDPARQARCEGTHGGCTRRGRPGIPPAVRPRRGPGVSTQNTKPTWRAAGAAPGCTSRPASRSVPVCHCW